MAGHNHEHGHSHGNGPGHSHGSGKTLLVALTGWGQERDRLRSEAAGFDRHMVKPADMKALRSLLATACETVRQARGALSSAG